MTLVLYYVNRHSLYVIYAWHSQCYVTVDPIMKWVFTLVLQAKLCIQHFTFPHSDVKSVPTEELKLMIKFKGKFSPEWLPASFNFSNAICNGKQALWVNHASSLTVWMITSNNTLADVLVTN